MRVPLSWLKEFVEVNVSPGELAERLTMAGLEVSPSIPLGASGVETRGEDTILEVEVLPNRPDCLSILGVAREAAALFGSALRVPEITLNESSRRTEEEVTVEVLDQTLCPRYMARVIRGVKIDGSPAWLKDRLILAGLRPINNVVDVTNYFLLGMGQPLHAFDLNLIAGHQIIVRTARAEERFGALDGAEHALLPDSLVIADREKAVALAGIMGGANTEVKALTTDVLLESAYFLPTSIHKTSRLLKISTESSLRFSRGVDWEGVARALDYAAQLIAELAGGEISKGAIDIKSEERTPRRIALRPARARRVLGLSLETEEITAILRRLGFKFPERPSDESIAVEIPLYRAGDIEREIDLIEEIARLNGYHKVPATVPRGFANAPAVSHRENLTAKVREVLTGAGFWETNTFSFVSPDTLSKFKLPEGLRITNPLSEDLALLRPFLFPTLLEVLAFNARRQISRASFFEVARGFSPGEPAEFPGEPLKVAAVALGSPGKGEDQFLLLKGTLENLISKLDFKPAKIAYLHPGRSAEAFLAGQSLGFLGELHPQIARQYEFPDRIYLFELNLDIIPTLPRGQYKPLAKFPSVCRDIALVVRDIVTYAEVQSVIEEAGSGWLEEVSLFDRYRGAQIPAGHYSLALSLVYRDPERTLTDEEVNQKHAEIANALTARLNAKIR